MIVLPFCICLKAAGGQGGKTGDTGFLISEFEDLVRLGSNNLITGIRLYSLCKPDIPCLVQSLTAEGHVGVLLAPSLPLLHTTSLPGALSYGLQIK